MTLSRKPSGQKAKSARTARVVIDKDRCKGCGFCIELCRPGALAMGQETNAKGYTLPDVKESECTGCSLCQLVCPDFAIWVISGDGEGMT